MTHKHRFVLRSACLLVGCFLCDAFCRGQNDFPMPQSVIPQLSQQPLPSQIVILGKLVDAVNGDMYTEEQKQQKQFTRLSKIEGDSQNLQTQITNLIGQVTALQNSIDRVAHAEDRKETDQWSHSTIDITSGLGCLGSIFYQVQQHKRRRKKHDEPEDEAD